MKGPKADSSLTDHPLYIHTKQKISTILAVINFSSM